MFILFGIKPTVKELGTLTNDHSCPSCGAVMRPILIRNSTFFTLFFIPVFPVHMKNYLICPKCQHSVKISFSTSRNLEYI